ncbi:hypothetical protein ABZP36_034275 [Zizania latifolia]
MLCRRSSGERVAPLFLQVTTPPRNHGWRIIPSLSLPTARQGDEPRASLSIADFGYVPSPTSDASPPRPCVYTLYVVGLRILLRVAPVVSVSWQLSCTLREANNKPLLNLILSVSRPHRYEGIEHPMSTMEY